MAKRKHWLVVDGYNVIGDWPILQQMVDEDMEEARLYLQEVLLDYCGYHQYTLLIVFDAYLSKGAVQTYQLTPGRDHQVVYTAFGQTADQYIERFVKDHSKDDIIVVSSDQLVQIMVFRYATRMSARELQVDLNLTNISIKQEIEKKKAPKSSMDERLSDDVAYKLEQIRLGNVVYELPPEKPKPNKILTNEKENEFRKKNYRKRRKKRKPKPE